MTGLWPWSIPLGGDQGWLQMVKRTKKLLWVCLQANGMGRSKALICGWLPPNQIRVFFGKVTKCAAKGSGGGGVKQWCDVGTIYSWPMCAHWGRVCCPQRTSGFSGASSQRQRVVHSNMWGPNSQFTPRTNHCGTFCGASFSPRCAKPELGWREGVILSRHRILFPHYRWTLLSTSALCKGSNSAFLI